MDGASQVSFRLDKKSTSNLKKYDFYSKVFPMKMNQIEGNQLKTHQYYRGAYRQIEMTAWLSNENNKLPSKKFNPINFTLPFLAQAALGQMRIKKV